MLFQVIILIAITSTKVMASLDSLTREEGEDVIFMFNANTSILEVTLGTRDGETDNVKLGLIAVKNISDKILVTIFPNTGFAERVSFVGDLSKGQARFKITNLNINDANNYMARMVVQGGIPGQYQYMFTKLIVTKRVFTTEPPTTRLTSSSTLTQDPTHFRSTIPPILNKLTTSLEVDQEFSKDLLDNTSESYTNFVSEFEYEIKRAYKDHSENKFKNVTVLHLRNGSINVTFIVIFTSGIRLDKACAPLENAIKNGTLGNFKIISGSLKCSKRNPSSPSTVSSPRPPGASTGVHPGIIAGVVVVGILAIAGLVITIIFVCRKKASKKDYRSSTGPGQRYEMEARHGEPEEQYASVQRSNASGAKQSPENDQPLPQYAAVDKTKKTKKKTKEPGELIYAQLDHDHNASMGTRPPSDRRSTGETGDTVYADIQGDKKKQRYPPPQYGNIHDMSYA